MISQLTTLAEIITDAVDGSDCEAPVYVTVGRPAAPSGDGDCTTIYVWGDSISDLNANDPAACVVNGRLAMQYEIWSCYPEGWEDQVTEDTNRCLYALMGLVWCALVAAKDGGELCDDSCFVDLGEMTVTNRLGQAVSALGTVTVPYTCTVPAETSPTSP